MWIFTSLETLRQDFRYSARALRKNPTFMLMAVVTLALGIGANTTIFSFANAVMIEPFHYESPDHLVRLWESNHGRGVNMTGVSAPNFRDWQNQQSVFEELAAWELATFNLVGSGEPERVAAASVTANLISTLGVTPALGRNFLPEEGKAGADRVALLSYGLWQRRFGGDPSALKRTIQLDGESYTVVGIMPVEFQFPETRELWVPLKLDAASEPWRVERAYRNLSVFGRLKPESTLDQATAEMNLISRRLAEKYPESNAGWGVRLQTFYDWIVTDHIQRSMLVLFIAVALLLMIACVNVANLLLARATARRQEMAIRAALGASRARLIRQLVIESLLLSILGGLLGIAMASGLIKLIASSATYNIPRLGETHVDGQALGFTLVISIVTGLIFGLAPVWWASRLNLTNNLNEGGRNDSGRTTHRLRSILVVAEVALAVALLISAGLMMRSFLRLQAVPLGFAPTNIQTMQISLPASKYSGREQCVNFFHQLLERLQNTPGVIGAAATTHAPTAGGGWKMEITIEKSEGAVGNDSFQADVRAVTPHYFSTMGIPLLRGREFTPHDRGDHPLNLIVSQSFAKRYWPNQDPIGKRFHPGASNPPGTVVGVVGDVRNNTPMEEARPTFYFPYGYVGMPGLIVMVRTANEPRTIAATLRSKVREIDNEQPIYNIRTMNQVVSRAFGQPRFQTILLNLFGVVALLLAAVGIYSVIAYLVRQRWREIGIRMMLGASSLDILRMIVRQGMTPVLLGAALGVAGAFALTRIMKSMLFGLSGTDPLSFTMVVLLFLGVAFIACYFPARRATRVNPSAVLRHE